jgi:hypothetical protein
MPVDDITQIQQNFSQRSLVRLSQTQLNTLEYCPRQFQYFYHDQLGMPTSAIQQERLQWGQRFHLLMQQQELGLPIAALATADAPLQQCIQAFREAAPHLFQRDRHSLRYSEHRRSLEFENYLLTVVYDLLILQRNQAEILDWKTYPRPQTPQRLAQNWQTRLYCFVLAETTDYRPDQIAMTYWFVQAESDRQTPAKPQSLKFEYSAAAHEQNRHRLQQLLQELSEWLQIGDRFPQIEEAEGRCQTCPFVMRCQRHDHRNSDPIDLPALADIPEVAL